jgi:hypothetical protein
LMPASGRCLAHSSVCFHSGQLVQNERFANAYGARVGSSTASQAARSVMRFRLLRRRTARVTGGSFSTHVSKCCWLEVGRDFSGDFQHPQNRCGTTKEVDPAVGGGDLLIGPGAGTQKVAWLVIGETEFTSRSWANPGECAQADPKPLTRHMSHTAFNSFLCRDRH